MFERFTDRARHVLVLATENARLLGHDRLGTEHLLLGLVHEHDGVAARALADLGIELDTARAAVVELLGRGPGSPEGSPALTPRAKKMLELSLREALQTGHDYIGPEHLLLGLVREGEGAGAQVLIRMGADLARVRRQVLDLLGPIGEQTAGRALDPQRLVVGVRRGPGYDGPRCPRCRAELTETARYRVVEVAPTAGEPGPILPVPITYCEGCGQALATLTPLDRPLSPE
jgi:ATP-dependent Clp protease ATP-binding subunit ClpA